VSRLLGRSIVREIISTVCSPFVVVLVIAARVLDIRYAFRDSNAKMIICWYLMGEAVIYKLHKYKYFTGCNWEGLLSVLKYCWQVFLFGMMVLCLGLCEEDFLVL
jgi:hypothetical protein